MLYPLIRPLLFLLDPECAHEGAVAASAWLAQQPELARLVRLLLARPAAMPRRLMGLDFPNPIGLAGGFDKNGMAPLSWWACGFGFAELGTVTPRPQSGNPRPRMFRLPREQAVVNRMGFNNDGAEAVAERLDLWAARGLRPPMPIAVSVGKNAATPLDQAAEDYALATERLAPHADFITMNVSSPNTPGLRSLQARGPLSRLVTAVIAAAGGKPVLVKFAPELEGADLVDAIDTCMQAGAAGFIATNTLSTAERAELPTGGLSGRPLRELSRRRVAEIRRYIGHRGVLIGCGGIDDAESARAMLDAGADLIQLYTGLIYRGPFLPARITRSLTRGPADPINRP